MTAAPIAIGIDVGGTKIAAAAVRRDGSVLHETIVQTGAADGVSPVIDRIAAAVRACHTAAAGAGELVGVGVALPGPVDAKGGIARAAVNLGWLDIPLRAELQARGISVPIALQNDVKAGAIGEGIYGAAQGVSDYVYLAVGTGLGGAAVSGGRLIEGRSGWAMEVGHIVVELDGRPCPCGMHGCAETLVSGVGILAALKDYAETDPTWQGREHSVRTVIDAARTGDPIAARIMNEAADTLGIVSAWCAMLYNPQRIVIGGGLGVAARDLLVERAAAGIHRRVHPGALDGMTVVTAAAPSTALGAAALVWHQRDQRAG